MTRLHRELSYAIFPALFFRKSGLIPGRTRNKSGHRPRKARAGKAAKQSCLAVSAIAQPTPNYITTPPR